MLIIRPSTNSSFRRITLEQLVFYYDKKLHIVFDIYDTIYIQFSIVVKNCSKSSVYSIVHLTSSSVTYLATLSINSSVRLALQIRHKDPKCNYE